MNKISFRHFRIASIVFVSICIVLCLAFGIVNVINGETAYAVVQFSGLVINTIVLLYWLFCFRKGGKV